MGRCRPRGGPNRGCNPNLGKCPTLQRVVRGRSPSQFNDTVDRAQYTPFLRLLCRKQNKSGENAMRRLAAIAPALLGAIGLAVNAGSALAADVKEIGSFHVGGQQLTLQGLPIKELVYTAGGPPTKTDPNSDFHTGQMYIQYVKLSNPKPAIRSCFGTAAV
jgi:hypothetical protein